MSATAAEDAVLSQVLAPAVSCSSGCVYVQYDESKLRARACWPAAAKGSCNASRAFEALTCQNN